MMETMPNLIEYCIPYFATQTKNVRPKVKPTKKRKNPKHMDLNGILDHGVGVRVSSQHLW